MKKNKSRRRYLKFRVDSKQKFRFQEINDSIQSSVLNLYGIKGLSHMNPLLLEFEENRQMGILRCNHINLRGMRASMAYITKICNSVGI